MKFRYVGQKRYDENLNEIPSRSYGDVEVKHGDTVELNDFYSSKALKNPNYEQVKTRKKSKPVESPVIEGQLEEL